MKKKILLVEYASASVDIIKDILSDPIFKITVVNEGETAKNYLEKESFDLMITAAMLPKFHGFNLSQYAANNYAGIKIIIISEIYRGMDYKHQAVTQYKADDFFEKPFDKEKFKKRVFQLLDIGEKDLVGNILSTTMQIPISDTKKIPTFKKVEDKEKKMSSEELFGDIIEKVYEMPSYEIELDENGPGMPDKDRTAPQMPDTAEMGSVTQKIEIPAQPPTSPSSTAATQKIDMDLINALKQEKGKGKGKEKFKKIEDDISKKFDDTISGLGLDDRKATAKKPAKKTKVPDEDKTDEVGGYEIIGLIGRGGMAEIYKAKKRGVRGFEKIIALKKILSGYGADAKFIEMFVDEAKIAAELTHPNIIQIYDLGKKDDYYFIAMEYVSGKDLRLILQKLAQTNTTMPEELAVYLLIKILAALNYAHSARDSNNKSLEIVHRDVSPPNILVSYSGNIKLTDFGVSKASIKVHQTLAGALKGKLLYMSPEQASGEENIDNRSDLYSAGVILFELITGEKLFLDSSEIKMLKKVQEGQVINPGRIKKDIDPQLEAIILKSLDKNIEKRYQKAPEMITALAAYMKQNYDNMPDAGHVAHFICDLFKEEIAKEGHEINLKPLPYSIKRIKKEVQTTRTQTEKEKKKKDSTASTTKLKVKKDTHPPDVPEEDLLKEEEFRPIIEIDFDEDKNKKVKKKAAGQEFAYAYDNDPEGKKKKNLLLLIIFIVIIAVLAIVIGFLLTGGDSSSGANAPVSRFQPAEEKTVPAEPRPDTGDKTPLVQDKKAAVDGNGTAAKQSLPRETPPKTLPKKKTGISKPVTAPKKEAGEKEDKPAAAVIEKKPPEQIKKQESEKEAAPKAEIKEKKVEKKVIVKEGDLVGLPEVDTQPVALSTPLEITRSIRRLLIADQRVMVSFLVDHKGNVEIVKLIQKSKMKKLNSLIIETVKKWKFKPATKDNKKVKVWKNKWLAIKK